MNSWRIVVVGGWAAMAAVAAPAGEAAFRESIRPVLATHCGACHSPSAKKSRVSFLQAETAADVEKQRGLWRSVAAQLKNRTMPPGGGKITEDERLQVAAWVEDRLRTTACSAGEYAGYVAPRRLNRREYRNTIRDLFGLELAISEMFPADEAGGAGFDTNGETLYVPPMMLERYMEAAQTVLDRVMVSPPLHRVMLSHELEPVTAAPPSGQKPTRRLTPGQAVSAAVNVFADGKYSLRVSVERPKVTPFTVAVKVDGVEVGQLAYGADSGGGATARVQVATLARGPHTITVANGTEAIDFYSLTVEQVQDPVAAERRAMHYRLLGVEVGQTPVDGRAAARRLLARFLPLAFRSPVDEAEQARYLALFERSAKRAEPFEEGVKLMLKAALVSPRFLFRLEAGDGRPGIQPLGQYAMASRLSYFLWSTMPDAELLGLAAGGQLQNPQVLAAQVERMLDDPRSRSFANAFVGQWLGTQEVGGRVVPLLTELQHYYTPEVAADLREQPELMFHDLLSRNGSVMDLLTGRTTFLTERLARFYEVEGQVKLAGSGFARVEWPDDRRAGVLGLASVLAMSSHYKQGSPVLRGAWVLDTLLGTPVPPPPPDVPPLETGSKSSAPETMRQMLAKHRASTACAACHNLMDPIGLGLENFDWMGRWRDKEANGEPVNATGMLPSGEKFNGPVELREVLVQHKEEFLRQVTGKVLGYALGRGLQDGDQCTVQKLMDRMAADGYRVRTLVRDVVLSSPFRNTQADAVISENSGPARRAPKRLLGTK